MSLDYCADQYALALAAPVNLLALSPEAGSDYSYLAEQSAGFPLLRPTGEEVLIAFPDLVIRQWGGGFGAASYLARFGIPVAQVEFNALVEGTRQNLRSIGASLRAEERAEQLIAQMDERLSRLERESAGRSMPRALYVTPGGLTTGSGTFVHEMLRAAGVRNMAAEGGRTGWQEINLESIALDPPDMIVGAFFDLKSNHVNYWSIAKHSFLREVMEETPTVLLAGALVACSAWFFVDAVEQIHEAATRWSLNRAGLN